MAKCDCGVEMSDKTEDHQGCKFTHVQCECDGGKKWHKKIPKGFTENEGERCHDCNALHGKLHHAGCDTERCPVCGMQALQCITADCIMEEEKV